MHAIICGAGITGLALANRLSTLGHDVTVLERSPAPRAQGYMIDFFGPGYDAIRAMGLLPALEEVAYHVDEAVFVDEQGRRRGAIGISEFASGDLASVMRPDLEQLLREHLPAGVDLRYGATLTTVTPRRKGTRVTPVDDVRGGPVDGVRVGLADGSALEADLLIGADGIHSAVRRLVFGPEDSYLRFLGFHTAAYSFDAPGIHDAVGGRFCMTDTIGSQFGFYALRDGRVASFAVHRTPDPTMPTDLQAAIKSAYAGLGWVVPEALAHCPGDENIYYDQVAQIVMPRWSSGRVVLTGDACGAVSLLAGQGASLGIAGAYVLADKLTNAPTIEDALREYEQVWRPVVEEKQKTGRSAARWFLPGSRTELVARRLLLRVLRTPGLRSLLPAAIGGKPTTLIHDLEPAR
ncbi:FAD-dependent monooxygenase [Kribbella solani]|uniref:2-polyprenyl-6-methoxyphenol hydroxylase-like FAD-dependent oxidoreductase n=1 Tax=Kribbella solani TaxID=236067 RepID=A0A841DQJ1_9ACTN|nr:FAD-dependent monooxygenase [Kribbella solani]MBB5980842.1 2-polyprenyl-6-methoxyphenol hydroxylase-like FAD-dependent oxidoreductase [Kribbella solani]